jgi:hypothetical protein
MPISSFYSNNTLIATFNWRGAWNNTTAYATNDAVSFGGSSYICLLGNTGIPTSNTTYWSLLAQSGSQGVVWRGDWSSVAAYNVDDAVQSGGSSYVCLVANTNQVPPNATYWGLMASKGATGDSWLQAPPTGINTQTANYTLALADAGTIVEMNVAGANTVTIPANASVAFPVGTSLFVVQAGAGTTTVVPAAGVTLDGQASLGEQWAEATLYKRATNEWVIGVSISGSNATALLSNLADQTISGGANVSSYSLSTGNITVDCGKCPLQYVTNGGAFTITAPAIDGSCMLMVENNGGAGAITFSGFTVGAFTGDALTTTNGSKFTISIWRINGISGYRIAAHQ